MENNQAVQLTSGELSQLWTSYQNDSGSICMVTYLLKIVKDPDLKALLEHSLQLSKSHIQTLTTLFEQENLPVPKGFSKEEDLNLDAPPLFTDVFIMEFMNQSSQQSLNAYTMAKSLATRSDIDDFYSKCLNESNKLNTMTKSLLLEKGVFTRAPVIPYPEKVDFVKKQSFLTGWFGNRRPLTALEIANIFSNHQRNAIGEAILIAFRQVTNTKEISEFFERGKQIAAKQMEVLESILRENDLPVPMNSDNFITKSTVAPISERLMLFAITSLISLGLGYYGTSMSTNLRRDLTAHYHRFIDEVLKYSEDGANLMIDFGWMEEPPHASNRDKLADQ
ncbi:DUF3231 family protein [Oceanobacillus halotolerans]|uniref:DUF3231 family protein n=1 Tax=Oceanobacillus halotolerans TaxID=2663380 RepID=UPI0013D73CAA|nr:DUF3231 family protein [Oceanobacillus halotolerans]